MRNICSGRNGKLNFGKAILQVLASCLSQQSSRIYSLQMSRRFRKLFRGWNHKSKDGFLPTVPNHSLRRNLLSTNPRPRRWTCFHRSLKACNLIELLRLSKSRGPSFDPIAVQQFRHSVNSMFLFWFRSYRRCLRRHNSLPE